MMPALRTPVRLRAAGNVEKFIFEYAGRMHGEDEFSLARMESPAGWSEAGQRPDFREITVVLSGTLKVETEHGAKMLKGGDCIICEAGEWVRYSTPDAPAEYLAVCVPAFSQESVNRDREMAEPQSPVWTAG
ncbi:MAG: cupin [Alphaproteobacteria bacterium]